MHVILIIDNETYYGFVNQSMVDNLKEAAYKSVIPEIPEEMSKIDRFLREKDLTCIRFC